MQLVAMVEIGAQRGDGGLVRRQFTRLAELATADREEAMLVEIGPVELKGFADSHPSDGE